MGLLDIPLAELAKFLGLVEIPELNKFEQEFDSTLPWALCNLTTGEYVRADDSWPVSWRQYGLRGYRGFQVLSVVKVIHIHALRE